MLLCYACIHSVGLNLSRARTCVPNAYHVQSLLIQLAEAVNTSGLHAQQSPWM